MSYKIKPLQISTKEGKKLMAVFINKDTNRQKTTHFGAKGMSDYSIHKDKERRERYRKRHQKDLKTRKNYLKRHAKEPKMKDGKRTNSYYADKILW